jgi:hypothetical protein
MDEHLERFLRETLGCGCPAEVLARVRVSAPPARLEGLPVDRLLWIGGRLLVVLCRPDPGEALASGLRRLVHEGVALRDRHGYNRVRIVVPVSGGAAGAGGVEPAFERCPHRDERVHLHLVPAGTLPDLGPPGV